MPRAQEKRPEQTPAQQAQGQAEQPTPTETPVAGFILMGAILYFSFVWWNLPSGPIRWAVTGILAAAVPAVWFAARRWDRVGRELRRWGLVAGDFLGFFLVVVTIIAAAVWLETKDQVVLLKVFTVLYFSLLPAVLYLQFSSRKTLTLWKEYVLNLHKLQADDLANLPRPPACSRFHAPWRAALERALAKKPAPHDEENLERANIYRLKFRDLFGPVPSVRERRSVLSLRSVHKLQVLITTVLVTLGWVFVVQPETVFGRSYTPADFELANLPPIPRETFAFAFLGAYFYTLQMLVRRYFQNDLKATAYINATMRIIIVVLLVWTLDPLLDDATSQAQRSAIAFVIGVFPTVGWQALQQLLLRKPLGLVVPSLQPERPHRLSTLDGLNIWYEARLLEVGIEDIQNLATTDIADVMLNTRIPVDRLIDWIDQAFLYLRVIDDKDRQKLRAYGIRSATDLLDVFEDRTLAKDYERLLNDEDKLPSRLRALVAAIQTERNLQHVRAWKSFTVGEEPKTARPPRARVVSPPVDEEAEAPPEAAPVPA